MRFQEVMARFLDTQKSVMLGFLGSSGGSPIPSTNGHSTYPLNGTCNGQAPALFQATQAITNRLVVPEPVSRPIAVPTPAVNGHSDKHEVQPPPEANGKHEPESHKPATGPLDRETLLARLLDLVSDRTGYPKEALSIDLDLEADLGIDSIKRVEILGALAESIEAGADGKQPSLEMEKLSVIKTLRGIADYVAGRALATVTQRDNQTRCSASHARDAPRRPAG